MLYFLFKCKTIMKILHCSSFKPVLQHAYCISISFIRHVLLHKFYVLTEDKNMKSYTALQFTEAKKQNFTQKSNTS